MVFRLFGMIRGKTLSASAQLVQGNFGALWRNSNRVRLKKSLSLFNEHLLSSSDFNIYTLQQ